MFPCHQAEDWHSKSQLHISVRAVQLKIPQQPNGIDCGLIPLFFAEGFLRKARKGSLRKPTAKDTAWDFRPAAVRAATYQRLEAFVDGDEGDKGDWVSDVGNNDGVGGGDVDDEEVDDGDATMNGETVVNTSKDLSPSTRSPPAKSTAGAIATGDGKPTPNTPRQRHSG